MDQEHESFAGTYPNRSYVFATSVQFHFQWRIFNGLGMFCQPNGFSFQHYLTHDNKTILLFK